MAETAEADFQGIQEVSALLGITPRTLRFYEDKGLITPQRVGKTRIYTRREIGRMQLILRGKKLGFSIREIQEFLDLYDADPTQIEQMRRLLERVRTRLADLEQQKLALDETIDELRLIENQASAQISRVAGG
ncbi:MerR family DNA-binding transcriptional regulator [Sphingomonas sp. C3-2]|uniref:MerR family transcriptional regulator n=1 Tax=Sphingomonas sp. C3-2 TaxID=3062169 RepID=UPI00294B7387|nr:MerR family DNA-binding transcriptional regulator [Sphingomonas sp. C3-2]WOK37506.1 MerR family DNA-binding transcriptional regulator [Sphingomonas sp. C3-2]